MKKIFYIITLIITLSMCIISCDEKQKTDAVVRSERNFIYRADTINGHTFYYDNTCALTDHECHKCEENFKRILKETIDSILDARAVENMAKGF